GARDSCPGATTGERSWQIVSGAGERRQETTTALRSRGIDPPRGGGGRLPAESQRVGDGRTEPRLSQWEFAVLLMAGSILVGSEIGRPWTEFAPSTVVHPCSGLSPVRYW